MISFLRNAVLIGGLAISPAIAQDTTIGFGGLSQDTSLPVEVASDSLEVNQNDSTATFKGNVLVTQGDMRLTAAQILVIYSEADDGTGKIEELQASGGVTLVNGAEAAESSDAVYNVDAGNVEMTGDVLLTQGQTAISGDRLTIDLTAGTGVMQGRVRTVFQSGQN